MLPDGLLPYKWTALIDFPLSQNISPGRGQVKLQDPRDGLLADVAEPASARSVLYEHDYIGGSKYRDSAILCAASTRSPRSDQELVRKVVNCDHYSAERPAAEERAAPR